MMRAAPAGLVTPDTPLAACVKAAANRGPRRGRWGENGGTPDLLLLHYTGMQSARKAVDWLTRAESQVSCHYLIDDAGVVTQMVREAERAWHAGLSHWAGATDINSASIGIEIHNPGHGLGPALPYRDFPDAQMRSVEALCRDIAGRHQIRPERVLAHSDVAPARKCDPGERFDWARLWRAGIGHWVEPVPAGDDDSAHSLALGSESAEVTSLQRQLQAYGYGLEPTGLYDQATAQVVTAFQRHWRRACVDGIADHGTVATLQRLAGSVPMPHG